MQKRMGLSLLAIALVAGFAALTTRSARAGLDDNAALIGSWQGSWRGDSSGKFEMTIAKSATGKLSGSISPTSDDGGAYTAEFKTIEIAAGKLTAKFDDPGGEAEITITGSAEGKSAKGTYTVRQKGDGTQVDTGSWTATKK